MNGVPALADFIRAQIEAGGPQSFAWFMEQALYHPELGYYAADRARLGRAGDYFTNVSVGPLFGRLLAAQFHEIWELLGSPESFTVVEQGAHHGEFADDVLGTIRDRWPRFLAALHYEIVEPFPVLRERQAAALKEFGDKVGWSGSVDELEAFTGVHFSNELLDAMPVHLLSYRDAAWQEKFVGLHEGQFAFVDRPISYPALLAHALQLPARDDGYATEVNLAALTWLGKIARKLERGFVLAIDYGYLDYLAPHRREGTMQARAGHKLLGSPFEQIGEADITAHVDWTSIAQQAETSGLAIAGFTDQHHFITGLVADVEANVSSATDPKSKRALQTLMHPEFLGTRFQVLGLSRDMDPAQRLSGFRFARDPRKVLGL